MALHGWGQLDAVASILGGGGVEAPGSSLDSGFWNLNPTVARVGSIVAASLACVRPWVPAPVSLSVSSRVIPEAACQSNRCPCQLFWKTHIWSLCARTHIHTRTRAHTHTCTHTHTHMDTHAYTHIHAHIHAHTQACTHAHAHTLAIILLTSHQSQADQGPFPLQERRMGLLGGFSSAGFFPA